MSICTYENITAAADSCVFVTANCDKQFSFFDFLKFYHCTLDQSIPLIVLMSIVFGILVFNFLGAISDSYLAPSLEVVSKKLKLSETIAGITLLAFAASAPDVVTGIVAGGKEDGGIRIAVGGLFGACLFTITMVLAGCILGSKQIEAEKRDLTRDIGFLMLSVLYFGVLILCDEVTPLLASGFFVLYAIFFIYVVITEKKKNRKAASIQEKRLVLEIDEPEDVKEETLDEVEPMPVPIRTTQPRLTKAFTTTDFRLQRAPTLGKGLVLDNAIKSEDVAKEEDKPENMALSALRIKFRNSWRRQMTLRPAVRLGKHHHNKLQRNQTRQDLGDPLILEDSMSEESSIEIEEEEGTGVIHTVLKYITIPILFMGDLTMPPFEANRWNRYTAAITPIFGPLLIIWELGFLSSSGSKWYFWALFATISLVLVGIMFYFGGKRNLAESHSGTFATITLLTSIFWLNLVSSLLVDFLSFIQLLTGLSLYFLSITLLAWGNSLEDFFVNYAIARKGYGKTALGGVYGSQIFAIMIGFGGGLFRLTLNGPVPLDMLNFTGDNKRGNMMTMFLLSSTLAVMVLTLVVGRFSKWVLGKRVVISVVAFYTVFAVGITLFAFV